MLVVFWKKDMKKIIIVIFKEYKDCFGWEYYKFFGGGLKGGRIYVI